MASLGVRQRHGQFKWQTESWPVQVAAGSTIRLGGLGQVRPEDRGRGFSHPNLFEASEIQTLIRENKNLEKKKFSPLGISILDPLTCVRPLC